MFLQLFFAILNFPQSAVSFMIVFIQKKILQVGPRSFMGGHRLGDFPQRLRIDLLKHYVGIIHDPDLSGPDVTNPPAIRATIEKASTNFRLNVKFFNIQTLFFVGFILSLDF